ncbi:MAG: SDR family NAD(P)-dependent oxidoreductase [Pseudomonadota bacterium]|jgi:NAD(P)-dependent dehydrogenase (short-subunit alcohol dehydrogenase family)|nr:MAG: short-chain dehydrogenase [Pseudomonadota bacterium]
MRAAVPAVQTPLAEVAGKTAFVTGGSSGIGLGIARTLSAAGMKVVFTYKNEAHRDAALASFPKDNPGVHAIHLDTTDREAMPRAADEAERLFGPVHLLVNNAGIGLPALLSNVSWQDWDWAMDVNINGVFNGVRTFLPRMLAHGQGGHIVSTSSSAGIVAGTLGVYATAKFAVVGMMESLRTEMEGRNIGVSVFCPGLVKSSIFDVERNRPASHGARGEVKPPPLKPGAPPIDIMAVAMDPMEAGRLVLEGIRRNDLYILTHPEFEPAVRERVMLMLNSFSKEPVPEGRRLATQAITPDIYASELAKKGLLDKLERFGRLD